MRRRKMGAGAVYNYHQPHPNLDHNNNKKITTSYNNRTIIEHIQGVIKLYSDGHVDRPEIMPSVPPTSPNHHHHHAVISRDIAIDKAIGIWARLYIPKRRRFDTTTTTATSTSDLLPLLFYFHGGGFCVGSASWRCYHDFLTHLAADARCVILSVNYRLAPENKLPTAYDDCLKAVKWWLLTQNQEPVHLGGWEFSWSEYRHSGNVFLSGDSSGGNIAFHLAQMLVGSPSSSLNIKGMVLIQPFFGGEARTNSEIRTRSSSVLSLAASDSYWRLALPAGLNRDHPWSNPLLSRSRMLLGRTLVCISELDILKDRNMEFCAALAAAAAGNNNNGNVTEYVVFKGVGHAFQILDKSAESRIRTQEMVSRIKDFIYR